LAATVPSSPIDDFSEDRVSEMMEELEHSEVEAPLSPIDLIKH